MRRCYLLVGFVCAAAAFVPAAAAQSSVGSSSCSDYRNATDPNQQALYAAYLQAYANAHSPDPRYTMSDAALTDDAKKVRDWCGKNTKRTYGEAVSAILGSASAGAAAAPVAPQPAAGAATYQTIPARKDRDDGDDLSVGGGSGSCLKTAGAVRANELVRRCLKVSPATHPPCNTENSCSMIRDEISAAAHCWEPGHPNSASSIVESRRKRSVKAGLLDDKASRGLTSRAELRLFRPAGLGDVNWSILSPPFPKGRERMGHRGSDDRERVAGGCASLASPS